MSSLSTLSKRPATLLGSVEPRLSTPPLRELTPETSYGFAAIDFARDVLGKPFEPWQEVAVIRGGELQADGVTPRFRKVLLIVSRQSGKTYMLAALTAFWLYAEQWPVLLGLHSTAAMARESWELAQDMAQDSPWLADEFGHVLRGNNNPQWTTAAGQKYKIAAATRKGGRGLSVDRLIIDELREQRDWVGYSAAMPSMTARPQAQAWLISNQGDEQSEVLNTLRADAIKAIEGAEGHDADPELGLIEWSAPEGASPDDPEAIAAACPRLGRGGRTLDSYLHEARASVRAGGKMLTSWRTEYLCQPVKSLDPAIDAAAWAEAADPQPMPATGRVLVLDVSPDQQHATLCAAALDRGKVRVELVASWEGKFATRDARRALPGLVEKVKPKSLGWFPSGPAASLAADLADRTKAGRHTWPPRGVTVQEIRGELTAATMGFAEQVVAGGVVHPGDPLLDQQVGAAERLKRGDAWVFSRKGAAGYCDAVYAAAGAVHLARTLPTGLGALRIVTAEEV